MCAAERPLAALDLSRLRQRKSVKWRYFPDEVLPAWVAEMDTPLAPPITEALTAAAARGDTGYAVAGRLPEAYAEFAERRYGWRPDPARMRLMPDVMRGVIEVLSVTTEPGDPVVVNTPVYPPFFFWLGRIGRRVVQSSLRLTDDGYRLDLDRLERDFAAGARAYLLCNPHNPTGRVFGREELLAVAELAERYDVQLIVDEVHAPLTYPDPPPTGPDGGELGEALDTSGGDGPSGLASGVRGFVPFGSLPAAAADRAVIAVSASKAWNLAGLKTALLVAGRDGWRHLAGLPEEVSYTAGIFGVVASEAAFDAGEPWLDALLADLDANRFRLGELLREHLPEIGYVPPQATYLAWLDCRALAIPADPAKVFLEYGKVAVNSGPTFGDGGTGFVRLNFATAPEHLAEVVRRMVTALQRGS